MKNYSILCNTTGEVLNSTYTLNIARYLRDKYNLSYAGGVTISETITDEEEGGAYEVTNTRGL